MGPFRATRFTLLFDPGRIKRGLKPAQRRVGPVLEEGKSYTLVIDRGWTDAAATHSRRSSANRSRLARRKKRGSIRWAGS